MRILKAGGTGMIGTALVKSLLADGHQIWLLTRSPKAAHLPDGAQAVGWDGRTTAEWGELVSQMDAVVNAEFLCVVAKTLNRPYWLPVPVFALRLVLGGMSTLVLDGLYLLPKRL
jgi:NAD dependent epimerase/dehydratase family enzyme